MYAYRETMKKTDKMSPLWVKGINTPTTTKVSVVVPANATPAQIQAAKVAQVSKQFGAKGGKAVVGKKLVNVYEIPAGAWSDKTKAGTGWTLKPQLLLK